MISAEPRTQWPRDLIKPNERGFVLTGRDVPPGAWPLPRPPLPFETSLPGVFAADDVRYGSVKRVAGAAGEGRPDQIPAFGIYAGMPLACRVASDEIQLLQ
jgi:thioredoxin reductase (NADPH)